MTFRDRMISRRATFDNLINQIYVTIACHVIRFFRNNNISIYKVNDNFVTNAYYASTIPIIYLHAFNQLPDPLYLLIRLIYENILK